MGLVLSCPTQIDPATYMYASEHIRFWAGRAAVLPKGSCRASGCAQAPCDLAPLCLI